MDMSGPPVLLPITHANSPLGHQLCFLPVTFLDIHPTIPGISSIPASSLKLGFHLPKLMQWSLRASSLKIWL